MEVLELLPDALDGLMQLINKGYKFFEFHREIKALKNDLERLKTSLETMDKVGNECLVQQILREVVYDVEDFTDECNYFLEKPIWAIMKQVTRLFVRKQRGRRKCLEKIKKKMARLRKDMKFFSEINRCPNQHQEQHSYNEYSILANNDDVVRLESISQKIRTWVLEEQGGVVPLKVIGIFGMAGVGKTTVAQKILNDIQSGDHFDYVPFIKLDSPRVDLKLVLKNILEKVTGNVISPWGDETELLNELKKQLQGKRYLFILDNVWQITERSWWDSLKSALPQENNGRACVIVTSRLKTVARSMGATERHIYHHRILSENDSRMLFFKISFKRYKGCRPPNEFVKAMAEEVADKCGGLPLAIKEAARVMSRKEPSMSNWSRMSQHFEDELHTNGKLLDFALRMSYEELPPSLRLCMLCFSIFPKDYEISLEEVVQLWESQGLIRKSSSGKTAFQIGEEYFDELINRCLLLGGQQDIFQTKFQTCRLHSMIRTMIIKIAKEKNFMLLEDEGTTPDWCSPRVGVIKGSNMDQFIGKCKSKKLRILAGKEIPEEREFISKLISKMCEQKHLRVLDLSFIENDSESEPSNKEWLEGIGSLQLLTCLRIQNSRVNGLPKSIMRHKDHLHTLCLSQCYNLKKLPPEIGHLKKLTVFHVDPHVEYLPIEMERLSNLEILLGFKPARQGFNGGCAVSSLRKFPQLRKLWIQVDSEDQIQENDLVVLSELKKLEILAVTLTLEEDMHIDSIAGIVRKVDCELTSPLEQLQHLYLHGFPGRQSPRWLNPRSLPNLSCLHVYDSKFKSFSRDFFGDGEKLWQLETLALTELSELEVEWPRLQAAMPCLRSLEIDECPKLRSLPCQIEYGYGNWVAQ